MLNTNLPTSLKTLYPYKSNFFKTKEGHQLHYIDEGTGPVLILVHGNPTWSFYFRNLINEFSKSYRVIVPDHIGCGLSDKPQEYNYCLKNHVNNLTDLLNNLNINEYSMGVHDWGGAIGLGHATKTADKINKLIILNTAGYLAPVIPKRINILRTTKIGEWFIRRFNGFAAPATFMAVTKKMPAEIKKGYLYPYNNYNNRIATARFVQDIPMETTHQSYTELKEIEESLNKITCPKLIIWGGKDFCFNDYFYNRWLEIYPDAQSHYMKDAGHYILEDKPQECIDYISGFLK